MPRVERIWSKRAHRGPMDPVDAATLVEGKGVEGSASFGSYRQVTIIALERWLAMMAELGADGGLSRSAIARRSRRR